MKVLTVGAELFRADRQTDRQQADRQADKRTDMTKLIVAFRNFASAPNEPAF